MFEFVFQPREHSNLSNNSRYQKNPVEAILRSGKPSPPEMFGKVWKCTETFRRFKSGWGCAPTGFSGRPEMFERFEGLERLIHRRIPTSRDRWTHFQTFPIIYKRRRYATKSLGMVGNVDFDCGGITSGYAGLSRVSMSVHRCLTGVDFAGCPHCGS